MCKESVNFLHTWKNTFQINLLIACRKFSLFFANLVVDYIMEMLFAALLKWMWIIHGPVQPPQCKASAYLIMDNYELVASCHYDNESY